MVQYITQRYERVQTMMYRIFGWMATGLTVTAGVSYYVFTNDVIFQAIKNNPGFAMGMIVAQLVLVMILSLAIFQLSYPVAMSLFILYSVLTGVTLSSIFVVYTLPSIAATFFVAAGMFAAMALYGAYTKADLTSAGTYLRMGLFGLLLALLVNMFLQNPLFDLLVSAVAVVLFAGLTAYDVQKFKQIAAQVDDEDLEGNLAIIGALQLYLDFLNIFLHLLRFMGQRNRG